MKARAIAAAIIDSVIVEKRALPSAFAQYLVADHRDTPLIKALCFGALRYYHELSAHINALLRKPIHAKDHILFSLLLVGSYELLHLHTPRYASVNQTVAACNEFNKPWAKKLINAILRNILRKPPTASPEQTTVYYSHPAWFIKHLQEDWPTQWQDILTANNSHPPLIIRVNERLISRRDYLDHLSKVDINAEPVTELPNAIHITSPCPVDALPGFSEGWCVVQDTAGQYAALLLDLSPQQRVLDCCAAPGSKTSHILQLQDQLTSLVAIDKDPARLTTLEHNLQRLRLSRTVLTLHATNMLRTTQWWDGKHFDRILVDAPCSATGVIRRHPDIKLLRQESDIPQYNTHQHEILAAAWTLLKPGGLLLYATCSLLKAENEKVIEQFCQQNTTAQVIPLSIANPSSKQLDYGTQFLPSIDGPDGFYYALLTKK